MKAVVLERACEANELKISEIEKPQVKENYVVVKIEAFGLNHSEEIFRKYEVDMDFFKKPIVPGIECVGTIEESLDSKF